MTGIRAAWLAQLGVLVRDGGRNGHQRAVGRHLLRRVADVDRQPFVAERVGVFGRLLVRAADAVAAGGQQPGDGAHHDAADRDDMDRAAGRGQGDGTLRHESTSLRGDDTRGLAKRQSPRSAC